MKEVVPRRRSDVQVGSGSALVTVFASISPQYQESCSDNNAGCTHGCIQGPFGAQCTCTVGYQLSNDTKTCDDIDECNPPGLCSQHCFNERGSFRCHCQEGYTLEADQRTCKASDSRQAFLLVASRNQIIQDEISVQPNVIRSLIRDGRNVVAIDFDSVSDRVLQHPHAITIFEDFVYWTDRYINRVMRAHKWHGENQTVMLFNLPQPMGLVAVHPTRQPAEEKVVDKNYDEDLFPDRINTNFYYFLEAEDPFLVVVRDSIIYGIPLNPEDKSNDAMVPVAGLHNGYDVDFDDREQTIYWVEHPGEIHRVMSDGTNRTEFAPAAILGSPVGLALDWITENLYYTNPATQSIEIERGDPDGTNRITIVTGLSHPWGVAVYQNYLFFSDRDFEVIERVDKSTGANRVVMRDNVSGLRVLKVHFRYSTSNGCSNNMGACEQLCLPQPQGFFACACATGFKLKADNRTCAPYQSYVVISTLSAIKGFSLEGSDHAEAMVPVAGRGNLYFTNAFLTETYVEVLCLNTTFRRVLLKTQVDMPRHLVVDPRNRYLYWADYGQNPKIERALLDGTNRTILVSSGIITPRGLALDWHTGYVYWVDDSLDMIARISPHGGETEIVRYGSRYPTPYGITVFENSIIWVDRNLKKVFQASKEPGRTEPPAVIRDNINMLRDVTIFDQRTQPTSVQELNNNPCMERNGGCAHFCFALPGSSQGTQNKKCSCAFGDLATDKVSCEISKEDYLIYTTESTVRSLRLDPEDHAVPFPVVNVPRTSVALDFDLTDNRIYFTQSSGAGSSKISYISLSSPTSAPVVLLLLLYHLCCCAIRQKIERSSLSGTNREVIVSTAIYPFAMTMFGQFIYWTDWNTRSIYRANKHDGSDQRVMIQNLPSRPMDIHVLARRKQQQCDSPCQQFNGGCSHICTPGPNGAECQCPSEGRWYLADSKYCIPDNGTRCQAGQFTCMNGRCIRAQCDRRNDCGDSSDEQGCTYQPCQPHQFTCQNGRCVSHDFVCDGDNDCGDESDELHHICHTPEPTCPPGEFRCENGHCIPLSIVCDRNDDCSDNSDEKGCGINECTDPSIHHCDHNCTDTPTSFICTCRPGYRLMSDGKTCDDINECAETSSVCSQMCENTVGSYVCKCAPGFLREPDGRSCRQNSNISPYLIFSNHYYLRNLSTDGQAYSLILQGLTSVVALDFDRVDKRLYWIDVSRRVIERMLFNGSNREVVVSGVLHGEGLAVDWIGRKLYWVDSFLDCLKVSELDGRFVKKLAEHCVDVNNSYCFENPRGIVLHPKYG
ncbi:hypothetical protein GOODEAATRI_000741 [Goodea atripinnis]|uniref:EGF-like domain-containing protein n=1 Tax=Goodea atripinnis TaxID=208336 RepID=A0ABV0PAA6_9TELE